LKSQSLSEAIQQPNELNTLKHSNDIDGEDDDEELEEEIVPESIQEELRRLENTIREEHETSERIMAQNIALLADLEVAQRMVRELKAGKNALALQLRNALQSAENR
jgi:phosphoenolpyruvate-protein kinase (PTS system EI component)